MNKCAYFRLIFCTLLILFEILNNSSDKLVVYCLNNGLALTPPMGWSGWKTFGCSTECNSNNGDNQDEGETKCISSRLFTRIADILVEEGFREVGYEYVQIDDCWSESERHWDGYSSFRLDADKSRFPDGIDELSRYMRKRGLKLGIYGNCAPKTPAGFPGLLKHAEQVSTNDEEENYFVTDARTFSEWQLEAFKVDAVQFEDKQTIPSVVCPLASKAINATTQLMMIHCIWTRFCLNNLEPSENNAQVEVVEEIEKFLSSCNVLRYFDDVDTSWSSILRVVDHTIKIQDTIVEYHGPGNWFDPDQLIIGTSRLSLDQAKAQMALWCIWAAPLYLTHDLRRLEDATINDLLKNYYLIEVNQDKMGVFGKMVAEQDNGAIQAFVKPIEIIKNGCPSFAIVYLNRNTDSHGLKVSFRIRDLLKNSAISIAARRFMEIYDGKWIPGGGFSEEKCLDKLKKAMTRQPNPDVTPLADGQVDKLVLEEETVRYHTFDLIEKAILNPVMLNETLDLFVPSNGARAVRLIEIIK